MALRLCKKMLKANCISVPFASRTYRHTLRHWPRVTEQEVESGQKLRNESCSARGCLCMCVNMFCICENFASMSVGVLVCGAVFEIIVC